MTFSSTQTIIKIGDSAGVTIPAKDLKRAGGKPGDQVEISFKLVKPAPAVDPHTAEVVGIAQELIARHKIALNNLSQR